MTIDPLNIKHLIADEGKLLRRISNKEIYGKEVILGKIMVNGKIVDDVPENFEEIDDEEPELETKKKDNND